VSSGFGGSCIGGSTEDDGSRIRSTWEPEKLAVPRLKGKVAQGKLTGATISIAYSKLNQSIKTMEL